MALEVDHIFICTEDPLRAERVLSDFGVVFSRRRVHSGQGTANACAFFDNAYLELLWRHDDAELQSDRVRPLALWERVRPEESGASPFGIALRSARGSSVPTLLETWSYDAPFLPDGLAIRVLTPPNSPEEPLVFLSPTSPTPEALPPNKSPDRVHRAGGRRLTGLCVTVPTAGVPRGLGVLRDAGLARVVLGADHHLELEWGGGGRREFQDFRPKLPLSLRW